MAKQKDLPGVDGPGVAPVRIPEIDAAAERYESIRDKRMAMTKKEVEAKKELSDLIHAHEKEIGKDGDGNIHYEFDNAWVDLSPAGEVLKVKRIKDEEE